MKLLFDIALLLLLFILPREYSPYIMLFIIGKILYAQSVFYISSRNMLLIDEIMLKEDLKEDEALQLKLELRLTTFIDLLVNILCLIYLIFLTTSLSFTEGREIALYVLIAIAMMPFIKRSSENYIQALGDKIAFMKYGTVMKKLGKQGQANLEGLDETLENEQKFEDTDAMLILVRVDKKDIVVQCNLDEYREFKIGNEILLFLRYR